MPPFHPKATALTAKSPPGWPRVEYVFNSDFQRRLLHLNGEIHPSPIDIQQFAPAARPPGGSSRHRSNQQGYTGEISSRRRFDIFRFCRRRMHGPFAGRDVFASSVCWHRCSGLFRQEMSLRRNFCRDWTSSIIALGTFVETFGRVVVEAMACGLPGVCHSHGGYADWIRHGDNGFLFDTGDEARGILARLVADAPLRQHTGLNARRTVEDMYSATAEAERLAFYLD